MHPPKSPLLIWFLRSLLILSILTLAFSFVFLLHPSPRSFSLRIQRSLSLLESSLIRTQQSILETDNYEQLPIDHSFYVFHDDTLAFWNDNAIEPKVLRKRVPVPCDTVLHFNAGDFFVKSFTKGADPVFLFSLVNTNYPIENEYFVNSIQLVTSLQRIHLCDSTDPGALPLHNASGHVLAYYRLLDDASLGLFDSKLAVVSLFFLVLSLYLLLYMRFSTTGVQSYRFKSSQWRFLSIVVPLLYLGLAYLGFKYLIHYGFTHGFFFPEYLTLSFPLFLYFIVFLLFVALLIVNVKFFLANNPWRIGDHPFLFVAFVLAVYAVLLTHSYNQEYTRYENGKIRALATTLSDERDLDFEQSYRQFLTVAQHDTTFFSTVLSDDIMEEVAEDYIRNFLFDSVMNQYNVLLTLCDPGMELLLEPYNLVSDCEEYFQDKKERYHGIDLGDGLAFMDDNTLDPMYLAMIDILVDDTVTDMSLFLEFSKPIAPPGYGLSRLLQRADSELPLNTSVASYQDSVLVYKFGSFNYPNYLSDFNGVANDFSYGRRMKHYTQVVDDSRNLVITVRHRKGKEKTIPYVFFFVSLMVIYSLTYVVGGTNRRVVTTLSRKFQVMVFVALGVSFFLVGPITVVYMRQVYAEKSNDVHYERTRSLLQDITSEVDFSFLRQPGFNYELDRILSRYSETFYTDINVYGLDGKLLSTTSPELQDLHLQALLMNAEAYQNMRGERSLYYIHDERLGKASFSSAYISIMDDMGNTLAYLNTPYFSSRSGLRSEIIDFVLTYVNIVLVIIFATSIIVFLLMRRFTYPLVQLQEKMRQIDINKPNELLEWKSSDEIGDLVRQYNQLVVELEKSTAELRRTATESAWRGAARQVAHEIKNSLTPMRLSIQMLERAADNHSDDLEQRIKRTSVTLIEQIDALSSIASTFSSYAKLPENHPELLDLVELVGHVVTLHDNEENVAVELAYDSDASYVIRADRTNLNSVVTNLVKNAVQAIGAKPGGRVVVSLKVTDTQCVISVKDNGKGIKEEDKKMIFLPNFTTKTSGSGLGLAYTYKLVHSMDGDISFNSEEGVGAEFIVELPKN